MSTGSCDSPPDVVHITEGAGNPGTVLATLNMDRKVGREAYYVATGAAARVTLEEDAPYHVYLSAIGEIRGFLRS